MPGAAGACQRVTDFDRADVHVTADFANEPRAALIGRELREVRVPAMRYVRDTIIPCINRR